MASRTRRRTTAGRSSEPVPPLQRRWEWSPRPCTGRQYRTQRSTRAPHEQSQDPGAAQCHDHRVRQTVQTGVPGRKRLIDGISRCKILRAVQSAAPRNTGILGSFAVYLPHTAALASPQLLHSQPGDIFVRETELIHLAYHIRCLRVLLTSSACRSNSCEWVVRGRPWA